MDAKIVATAICDAESLVRNWGKPVDKRLLTKMVKAGLECFDGSTENANGAAFESNYKDGLGILICRRSENEYITRVFAYPHGSGGCRRRTRLSPCSYSYGMQGAGANARSCGDAKRTRRGHA